jgi:lysophospholipase L1-like esterase
MWARVVWLLAVVVTVAFSEDCSTPSAPTPLAPPAQASTPPPVAPPTLSCPSPIAITAPFTGPARVNYTAPSADGGAPPVTVGCTPQANSEIPIGTTTVECTATDAQQRTASCSFPVTVAAAPRLRRTRILAFGDSITAGDVVVPGTDNLLLAPTAMPYPAVLAQLIRERYGDQPAVFNAGLSGEHAFASNTLPRFTFASRVNNADAVVILEGFNDILYADPPRGIADAEFGVSVLAADARNRGMRVFIALLTPTKPGRRQIPLGVVQAANDRLRAVARGEGGVVIDTFTPLLADLNSYIDSDGLHLTAVGYRKIGETIFAALRDDLEIK